MSRKNKLLLGIGISLALLLGAACAKSSIATAAATEVDCLAKNIYYEARSEPIDGQIAVAQVTMNRVYSSHFPNTICGVVYEPYQFSWTHMVRNQKPKNKVLYRQAQMIALEVLFNVHDDLVSGATFYHATYVKPVWRRKMDRIGRIGTHIFYTYEGR